ncbi:hypothetical protein HF086_012595 [Spodoptera exigua]|uniref:UDP-glucuronosyltransferase n=1 Tax=Spodoptera exigua TaxID=7107 RepID=A0A922MGZ5_SPOEX|nr:hypothetical protein HF086_012595 [Spodoptera exigua]
MEKFKCLLFFVVVSLCSCDAYKILAVFPMPSPSHGILGDNMVKHLLNAGHEVTYITPFASKQKSNPKLHIVDVTDHHNFFNTDLLDITQILAGSMNFKDPNFVFSMMMNIAAMTLEHRNVQKLMKDPQQKFDVIIGEYMFADLYSTEYYKREEEVYQKHIVPILKEQGKPVPDYKVLKYNASLLLGNSQVAIGNAVPLPPSYKHIGGYHIEDEVKPLPEDLKKIMDNAKNGVIYFSLGSNLKSKNLPDELKKGLLEVFGGLKQTVLWKFEENLPNQPKNVHIVQWAPQQSLLAHPNLVLFVTHGGLLSLTEAVHFGVPVIAIPVFADQFLNANQAQHKGIGEKVDLTYNLHKDLKVALDKVLADLPKYTGRMKELSTAYHDSPMKPKEALNFWVEHVVRTRGATHLRSVALQVPLYQQAYLDLLVVLLAAAVAILLLVKKILCYFKSQKSIKQKEN